MAVFGLDQIEQADIVVRPDALAEVVEQFDHGESLLWCPGGRDIERDRQQPLGRGRRLCRAGHDLAPRRWRARCSLRSRASFRR